MTVGLRLRDLGSDRLNWRDLLVLVRRWQKMPGTALSESVNGLVWSVDAQLLAIVADAVHMGNWQRAGKKHAPKPKRIPRPWEQQDGQSLGSDPVPIREFDSWWDEQTRRRKKSGKEAG